MAKGTGKRIAFYSLHVLGFVLLYLVLRNFNWQEFFSLFTRFNAWYFISGLVVLFAVYILKSIRWYFINKAFNIKLKFWDSLMIYLVAGFFSAITPGRLGEFTKIYFLKEKYPVSLSQATLSVLFDRLWDVLVLSMIAGISLFLLFNTDSISSLTFISIFVIFLLSLSIVLYPGFLFVPAIRITGKWTNFNQHLESLYRQIKMKNAGFSLLSFVLSLVAFLMLAFIPVALSFKIKAPVNYDAGLGAISVSNILSFLPVSVAGFGTREYVFKQIWALYGYPAEIAITVSTAYFIVTYLGSVLFGGLVSLFYLGKSFSLKNIRHNLERENTRL